MTSSACTTCRTACAIVQALLSGTPCFGAFICPSYLFWPWYARTDQGFLVASRFPAAVSDAIWGPLTKPVFVGLKCQVHDKQGIPQESLKAFLLPQKRSKRTAPKSGAEFFGE